MYFAHPQKPEPHPLLILLDLAAATDLNDNKAF
jgi:hypothetical protein